MWASWTAIKNDPLIKAVIIIILGVLGFGFAFNMMFGQRNSMDGGEMSGGYSSHNLSYWLAIALKLLLIALVIFAVIAIIRLLGKHLLKGGETNLNQSEKNDSLIKTLGVIVLTILAIGLLILMFGGYLGLGNGLNLRGEAMVGSNGGNPGMMGGYYNGNPGMMGGTYYGNPSMMDGSYNGYFVAGNSGFNLSMILIVLLKILLYVSIVGLVIGLGLFFYKSLSRGAAERTQPINPVSGTQTCSVCNTSISNAFAFCPVCGAKA